METTINATLPAMLPASTEISRDASAKVEALAHKETRTRAFVLRRIIHEWADKQPTPKAKKS